MSTNKTVVTGEGIASRVTFGVWGFTHGFLGAADTIEEAKSLISKSRHNWPSIRLFDVYQCRPGWYSKDHRIYSEGYPRNQQDL